MGDKLTMDYYKTLGVERDASPEEIKKAYRRLSMQFHPDKNNGDKASEEKFKEINEAYSTLSNPDKKREYDNPMSSGMGFDPFGMFRNMSNGFGGHTPPKPDLNTPRDGKLIVLENNIPLKLFLFGGKYEAKISFHEGCKECGGKGFDLGEECDVCHGIGMVQHVERRPGFQSVTNRACHKCNGLGQVSESKCSKCDGTGNNHVVNKSIVFQIEPGSRFGSRYVAHGEGRSGLNGGNDGDVLLVVVGVDTSILNKLTSDKVETLKELLEEK